MSQRTSSYRPFVFSLEPTLKWTDMQAAVALGKWQEAWEAVTEAQSVVDTLATDLQARSAEWRNAGWADPRRHQERAAFLSALRECLDVAQVRLLNAKQEADKLWQAWQQLQSQADGLVELRCQLREAHEREQERTQQSEQDRDWLARRHIAGRPFGTWTREQ